jgi:hypothetical protein
VLWQISKPSDFWFDATHSPDIAMLTPLNAPRRLPNGRPDLTGPLHLSDGPIDLSYLATKVIGASSGVCRAQMIWLTRQPRPTQSGRGFLMRGGASSPFNQS